MLSLHTHIHTDGRSTLIIATDPRDSFLYLPEGYSAPESPLEALRAAREVLAEEGRWCQGEAYRGEGPYDTKDEPYCGSWGVCAVGAVNIVTQGVQRRRRTTFGYSKDGLVVDYWDVADFDERDPRKRIYMEAVDALDAVVQNIEYGTANEPVRHEYDDFTGDYITNAYEGIIDYNDHGGIKRDDVLNVFDQAIKNLGG